MRTFSLVPLMCALASPAFAEDFFFRSGHGVSFEQRAVVELADADLALEGNVVRAKFGLRREKGREQLASSTVLTLGDVLLVKDAAGRLQRLRFVAHAQALAHLVWIEAAGHVGTYTRGEYQNTSAAVNGSPTGAVFGRMELCDDGRFSLGRAEGTWTMEDGRLALSNFDSLWGYPEVTQGGSRLVFRFVRGKLVWEITFERAVEANEALAASGG